MYALRIIPFVFIASSFCDAQDVSVMKTIRTCLGQENTLMCLKETALDMINETILSDKPIRLFGVIDVLKDPNYHPENKTEVLPADVKERSLKLNNLLYKKIEEFLESRSIKFNLANIFEGRDGKPKKGRGKKDKKGGMLMMGGLAMAGMMAQMFMGKMVMMSGAALMMAKVALMISVIVGIKKLGGGGGGGEPQHVVYTQSDSYGHGGGWHRSINHGEQEAQNMAYRGHTPEHQASYSY